MQDGAEVYAWFDMLGFPYDNAVDEDPVNLYSSARLINTVLTMERDELVRNLRRRGGIASLPEEERARFEMGKAGEQEEEGEFGTVAEKKWASGRIVLSGFSQGSVMTLLTGLTTRHRLAGLVVMSGFMPLRSTLKSVSASRLALRLLALTVLLSTNSSPLTSTEPTCPFSGATAKLTNTSRVSR